MPTRTASQGRVPRVMRQVGLWVSIALIAAISALAYFNIRDLASLGANNAAVGRHVTYTIAALGVGTLVSIAIIVIVFYRVDREAARRRRAEAELEQRVAERTLALARENEERRKAEEHLRAIIDEAPFAVVAVDPARRIQLWSRGAETVFGYTAEEAVGQSFDTLLVPSEEAAKRDRVWKGITTGAALRRVSARRLHKSGRVVDVLASGRALVGDDGVFRGAIGILEDITDQLAMERQLRQAQRMEAVGQLTGGLAHDFNNILSIVVGNVDLLIDKLGEGTKERAFADSAMKGALRGAELVQRLLAFSRKQPLAPRPIDLNARLPNLEALLRRTLGERVEVRALPGEALWPAIADPAQFEDALLNLAINARDAMPKGGVLTIETANVRFDEAYVAANPEAAVGEYVMVAVSDTGTGMPPEVAERAFEPFFTTKETGKGSGLGLSMVYGFVKQSHGHVKIYTEPGHGTSIKLYLPRSDMAAEPIAVPGAPPAEMPRGTERVLLVEDNAGVREAAERTLAELGYRVHAVADADQAIAWLDRGEVVDLLFTDLVMPGTMNGRELAAAALERRPRLKVLLTTGYAEGAAQGSNGNGAYGNGNGHAKPVQQAHIIGKPYRKLELARMLRKALEGSKGDRR